MALSEATLRAIQRAQNSLAKSTFSTAASSFGDSYQKAYKAQIEANKKEEEELEKNKIASLKNRDILMANGESLGYFTNIGAGILNNFADQYADTHKLSQYEGQVAQRNINREAQIKLKPYAEAAELQMETIDSVEKGILDKSLKNFKDEKTGLSHYTILQEIAKTDKVYEGGFIIKNKNGEEIKIPFEDVPELKNVDVDMLNDYNSGINELIRTARSEKMSQANIESMVTDFVMNLDANTQKNVLANYHSIITDDLSQYEGNEPALSNLLEQRITATINNRYKEEIPEVDEPETDDDLTPSELTYKAGKALYDEQINTIRSMRLPPEMSPKEYYRSQNFINDLPTNFIVEKTGEGDDMQIDIYNSDEKTMQGESRRMISVTNQSLRKLKEQLEGRVIGKEKYFEKFLD
jgi:hypothetical protein